LRAALLIGVVGWWVLAAATVGIADSLMTGRAPRTPDRLDPVVATAFILGTSLWVISFAAVAAANRAKQIRGLVQARRDAAALSGLLRDMDELAPGLAFPDTGWTPLLLHAHAARVRHRVEARDRLVMLSPVLAQVLDIDQRQSPREVAEAISRLRRSGSSVAPRPTVAAPILTMPSVGDHLTELALKYTALKP
jgi:hypothetical protein